MLTYILKTNPFHINAAEIEPQIVEYKPISEPDLEDNLGISFDIPESPEIQKLSIHFYNKTNESISKESLEFQTVDLAFFYSNKTLLIPLGRKQITTTEELKSSYFKDVQTLSNEMCILKFRIAIKALVSEICTNRSVYFKEAMDKCFDEQFFNSLLESTGVNIQSKLCEEEIINADYFSFFHSETLEYLSGVLQSATIFANGDKTKDDILSAIKESILESKELFQGEQVNGKYKLLKTFDGIVKTLNDKIRQKLRITNEDYTVKYTYNISIVDKDEENGFFPKKLFTEHLKSMSDDENIPLPGNMMKLFEYSLKETQALLTPISKITKASKINIVVRKEIDSAFKSIFEKLYERVYKHTAFYFPFILVPCETQICLLEYMKNDNYIFRFRLNDQDSFTKPYIYDTGTNEIIVYNANRRESTSHEADERRDEEAEKRNAENIERRKEAEARNTKRREMLKKSNDILNQTTKQADEKRKEDLKKKKEEQKKKKEAFSEEIREEQMKFLRIELYITITVLIFLFLGVILPGLLLLWS